MVIKSFSGFYSQRSHGGNSHGIFRSYDAIRYRKHRLCSVDIKSNIDLFFPHYLHRSIGDSLHQRPIRTARPSPVCVPDIQVGEELSFGIMNVDIRIRPLIQRCSIPVSHPEFFASPLSFDFKIEGIAISGLCVPAPAVIELGDDDQGSFFDHSVF